MKVDKFKYKSFSKLSNEELGKQWSNNNFEASFCGITNDGLFQLQNEYKTYTLTREDVLRYISSI